jgi:hypothetical protein
MARTSCTILLLAALLLAILTVPAAVAQLPGPATGLPPSAIGETLPTPRLAVPVSPIRPLGDCETGGNCSLT